MKIKKIIIFTAAMTLLLSVPFTYGADINHTVIATIPVGDVPQGVGVNPNTNRIYVANLGDNNVSVIDGFNNNVIATVPVGAWPRGIGVNPNTNRIYVTNSESESVSVIDGVSNIVITEIAVGKNVAGIAVNPNINLIYVTNDPESIVSVIDGNTNTVLTLITVDAWPRPIAVNSATNRIYVGNANSDTLSVIDGNTNNVISTIAVGPWPGGVGVNQATNHIYVTNIWGNDVSDINGITNAVVTSIPVGDSPKGVAVDHTTNLIYVTLGVLGGEAALSVIDGSSNTVIDTIPVGIDLPGGIDVNTVTKRIYVSSGDNNVYVILNQPSEVWVDDDYCNGCSNDGHTWDYDAFDNIQDGIDAVASPGTVYVAAGIYEGKVVLKTQVSLLGTGMGVSIIDGMGLKEGVEDTVVAMASDSKISGFSIINGGWNGVECRGVSAIIEGNLVAHHEAIGIHVIGYGSRNSIVSNNIVTDCASYMPKLQFVGAIFGNSVYGSPQIIHNTVVGNHYTGIGFCHPGTPIIKNNIVVGNVEGIGVCGNVDPNNSHNNSWNNVAYNWHGLEQGEGAISSDPLFVDEIDGDYHLQKGSPCIDTGTTDVPDLPDTDFEGEPRIVGIAPDMGADEYQNQPPEAICQDVTVSTDTGSCTANASIDDGSFDPDGDDITLDQEPEGPYDLGETNVTLTVTDDKGASDTCEATVKVIDEEDPVISSVTANPNKLWPPNHKMVPVTVAVDASDNCDLACQIISVASNESVNGLGDGDTAPDWVITGDLTVKLRAERSGKGNGRIYTITVECADSSGNSATDTAKVTVPHDKAKKNNQNNKKKK